MATSMNISLPEPVKSFIDEQVERVGYSSPSEYIRDVVRRDQNERAQDHLEQLLMEGLDSGNPIPVNPEYWNNLRNDLQHRRRASTSLIKRNTTIRRAERARVIDS